MKRILRPLLCLLLCGCELVETGIPLGSPRGRDTARSRRDSTSAAPDRPAATADTTLWFSAVVFPDGYDWHRDSAAASVDARIVLYKDFEPVVSVHCGGAVSTDADMHHIIGGDLYTEGVENGRTVIGRNGVQVLSFDGAWFLKGLLPRAGSIYTLSQSRGGSAMTLRKDGTVLFTKERGNIFGSLSDAAFAETGALYGDGGDYVFCYWSATNPRNHYCVRNGCEEPITNIASGLVLWDLRYIGGQQWAVTKLFNGFSWEDARFWAVGAMPALSGTARDVTTGRGPESVVLHCEDFSIETLGLPGATVYVGDRDAAAVLYGRDGTVSLAQPGRPATVLEGKYTYISDRCCAICGKLFVMALSPSDIDEKPFLLAGGRRFEVDINGFISAVAIGTEKED